MTLADIHTGEQVIIHTLLNTEFTLKLVEIGFYENKMITVDCKSVSCDPICVQLGNSKIMLRKEEAESIIVRKCETI